MRSLFVFFLANFFAVLLKAQPACVTNNCCCGTPIEVGIPNGNFEDAPMAPVDGRITFYAGENYSTWYINSGSIDLLGPNYSNFTQGNPNGASQFIDLNGFAPGTISTTLSGMTAGAMYTIVLWYAINPGASVASCNILVANGAWLNASWSATNPGGVEWLEKCFTFTAQGATAELKFIGSSNFTTAGMLLDDMTMWTCPVDNEAPVVSNPPSSPLNIECSDPVPDPEVLTATDNCSSDLTTVFTEQNTPQACFYNLLRTWVVSDECGNSTTVTQQIRVEDTQAPQFVVPPGNFTLPCGEDHFSAFFNWLNNHGDGEADDNCDPNVTWTYAYQSIPTGQCATTAATFTVTDDCGNKNTATAYFIIEDIDPPLLLQEAQNDTVICDDNASNLLALWLITKGGALASDPCGPVLWSNNFNGDSTATEIEVTFTATDACQNSVSTTAYFVQPNISETIFINLWTCDPQQAGVEIEVFTQGACEIITITTTTLAPTDTTLLFDQTCDTTQTGVFTDTLSNQYGCDSLVITTVDLLPSDLTELFTASCDTALVGVFTQNLNNQFGCDSLVVTTVDLLPSDTTLLFETSCDTAQVGLFTQTFSNQNGCDSLIITTVSLLPTDTTLLFQASCDITQTQVFTQNFIDQDGCDSLVITTISPLLPDTTLLFGESCDAAQTGVFTQMFTNQNGCDSLVVTTIDLLLSDTILLFSASCDAAQTGVFTQNLSNQNGCDSLVITTVDLLPSDSALISSSTCDPDAAGIFIQNLNNQYGCDSTVIETVTLFSSDSIFLFDASCNPASVGVFTQSLVNQNGCDSTVVTTVVFSQSDTTLLTAASCDPSATGIFTQNLLTPEGCDSVVITTVSLLPSDTVLVISGTCDPNAAGIFIQNFSNQYGCDSTVIETVALYAGDTTLLTASSCDPAAVGIFTQNLFNQNGCDSLVVTAVSLLPSDTVLLSSGTCNPNAAGIFIQNYNNQYGCDSTVIETVALYASDTTLLTGASCDVSQTGVFTQNLFNQNGCDSLVITTVSLLPSDTVYTTSGTCDPASVGISVEVFTNQYGCDSVLILATELLPQPQVTVSGSDYNGYGLSCSGSMDGSAQATASGVGPFGFSWSNGLVAPGLSGLAAGTYTVTATDANGCTAVSTLALDEPEPLIFTLAVAQPDCFEEDEGAIVVQPAGGTAPYQYALNGQAFQAANQFDNLPVGAYQITAVDANGCSQSEALWINQPLPVFVDLGDDLTIDLGDQATLQALVNIPLDSLSAVIWSLGDSVNCPLCLTQVVQPLITTAYSITVLSGNGCQDSDTVRVLVNRRKNIYVPNAFSPNDDGVNDVFLIFAKPGAVLQVKSFYIFDRWGDALFARQGFQPNDPELGWDGRFRGQAMNPGVYVWWAELEFLDGEVELIKGDVLLVR